MPDSSNPDASGEKKEKPLWLKLIGGAASFAIVVAIFAAIIPRFANYRAVWEELKKMTAGDLGLLLTVTAANVVALGWVPVTTLPGLKLWQGCAQVQASSAVSNAVPGGGAFAGGLTWAMFRSWGHSSAAFARSVVLSGIWNTFVKLGTPVIAVALLAFTSQSSAGMMGASIVGLLFLAGAVALFIFILRSEELARKCGEIAGRVVSFTLGLFRKKTATDFGQKMVDFRTDSQEMIETRWLKITLSTTASQLSVFMILYASLRAAGVTTAEVSFASAFAAFTFVRLVTTIPITPGGVGVAQAGLLGMLTQGLDPAASAKVGAAVMLYTLIAYLLTFPLGAISYVAWRVSANVSSAADSEDPGDARPRSDVSDQAEVGVVPAGEN